MGQVTGKCTKSEKMQHNLVWIQLFNWFSNKDISPYAPPSTRLVQHWHTIKNEGKNAFDL